MNILTVAWKVYDIDEGKLAIKRDGFSVMVANICEYIGRKEKSYIMVGDRRVKSASYGNVNLVNTWEELSKEKPVFNNADIVRQWHAGLLEGFKRVIIEKDIDFVFFHGVGEFELNCKNICQEKDIGFAFVLHGYLGERARRYDPQTDPEYLKYEKVIIEDESIPIVVVGYGTKNCIIKDNVSITSERISVIVNGIENEGDCYKSILNDDDIGIKNKKTLLCVGTMQPRKNQLQLVRAYSLITERVRKNISIVICGNEHRRPYYSEKIKQEIKNNCLENNIFCVGERSREELSVLYGQSAGVIQPSLSEGLSLVAIESISHGKPIIMFMDNETACDVNDQEAVVLVDNHSDQALADAIEEWYYKEWDENYIREYSKYFNMERVADEYIKYVINHLRRKS